MDHNTASDQRKAADIGYIKDVSARLKPWLAAHKQLTNSAVIYGGSVGPGLYTKLDGAVSGLFLGRRAHDPLVLESVLGRDHRVANQVSSAELTACDEMKQCLRIF